MCKLTHHVAATVDGCIAGPDHPTARNENTALPVLTPSTDDVTVLTDATMTGLAEPSRGSAPNSAPGPT
ncbi:hypothetical protein ACFU6I_30790 [Streptomyces sp. NPDC057486]|uniref:hypothetical protein n=1 Tax=Streptomyces sp. NPDC057486 TaxID=3346145 RepID=UPI0036860655